MNQNKPTQRILAWMLSVVMVLGMTPITAMAETLPIGTSGEIIAFEALSEETANQDVALGTSLEKLNLPETLTATVLIATATDSGDPVVDSGKPQQQEKPGTPDAEDEEDPVQDSGKPAAGDATPSEGTVSGDGQEQEETDGELNAPLVESTTGSAIVLDEGGSDGSQDEEEPEETEEPDYMEMTIPVPVTWTGEPDYDGNAAGTYTFTAEVDGFSIASGVEIPKITVTVGEAATKGTVTAFDGLSEDIRWQNTTAPVFPETVSGTVEGKHTEIPVTWATQQDFDGDYPVRGLYVFSAQLGEGFTLAEGVEPLIITVFIPETVSRFAMFRMGGAGTAGEPLEITTAAQLAEIATLVNARANGLELFLFNDETASVTLKLMNDLDLSGYASGEGWVPIGKSDTIPFNGDFDGDGHVVRGLYINRPDENFQGLFGCIDYGAQVKDLGLEDVDITGKDYVGGLVGYVYSSPSQTSKVQNCYVTGSITGADRIGGVAGHTSGSLQNCYSAATISGTDYVGGIAGRLTLQAVNTTPGIINCVALNPSVSASSPSKIGRIVGGDVRSTVTLSGNYAFSGMTVTAGGEEQTITGGAVDNKNGAAKTAAEIKADGTLFSLFTTTNGWTVGTGKLPGFGAAFDMPAHIVDGGNSPYFSGAGTEENPYQISTAAQLAKLADLVNSDDTTTRGAYYDKHYKLMNDLDLSAYGQNYDDGKGWTPIGKSYDIAFEGDFDGDGHLVRGLYINRPDESRQGLFGCIDYGAQVKDLGLEDVDITGKDYVGSLVGNVISSPNQTSKVQNCYVTGSITGADSIGGVAGHTSGSLQNCYSAATISSTGYVGGIAGYLSLQAANTTPGIINCIALNPRVSASSPFQIGRIVGYVFGDITLSGNYAFSGMTVTVGGEVKTITDGAADNKNGAAKTAADLQVANGFPSGFNADPWTYEAGKLPGLNGQAVPMPLHLLPADTSPFGGGNGGSADTAYQISTAAQLTALAELVNSDVEATRKGNQQTGGCGCEHHRHPQGQQHTDCRGEKGDWISSCI